MRARAGILGLCACLLLPPSVSAQGLIGPRNAQAAVLVVDMKRIKSDTAAGRDMLAKTIEIRRRIQAGVAERGESTRHRAAIQIVATVAAPPPPLRVSCRGAAAMAGGRRVRPGGTNVDLPPGRRRQQGAPPRAGGRPFARCHARGAPTAPHAGGGSSEQWTLEYR